MTEDEFSMKKFPYTRDEIICKEQADEYNHCLIKKIVSRKITFPESYELFEKFAVRPPLVITLEGKDRVGKTETAKKLQEVFDFDVFKFPYEEVESGKILRAILDEKLPHEPWSFQALMILNKEESIPFIKELGYKGGAVVFDRGHESAKVYGVLDGIPEAWIDQFDERVPYSDLTIVLDGKGWENDTGIYSDPVFQQKVKDGYLRWVNRPDHKNRVALINADRSRNEVFRDVVYAILEVAKIRNDRWLINKLSKVINNA
ncbi:MAG: hypothetical protein PHN80_16340 [Hespellia sp.]|nr:hypothetical protein [Hespellia sp.]